MPVYWQKGLIVALDRLLIPLVRLHQIEWEESVNCHLQVWPQMFFDVCVWALDWPLIHNQTLAHLSFVLAVCFGLLFCWKMNLPHSLRSHALRSSFYSKPSLCCRVLCCIHCLLPPPWSEIAYKPVLIYSTPQVYCGNWQKNSNLQLSQTTNNDFVIGVDRWVHLQLNLPKCVKGWRGLNAVRKNVTVHNNHTN